MKLIFCVLICTFFAMNAYGTEDIVNAADYDKGAWSPYLVGALIGILTCMTFYFSGKAVGASSFYATLAGMIGNLIAEKHTKSLQYYKENPPRVNWEFIFVLAAVGGAFVAAWTGGEFEAIWLPQMWKDHFGAHSFWLRIGLCFVGGLLMAFGARLAGGCTSGHGISGTIQLNVASWIAVICFFVSGVIVANLLFSLFTIEP